MGNSSDAVILCVDDSKVATAARCSILQSFGFRVLSAYSGSEAMEVVNAVDRLDLVLLDYELGDSDASTVLPAIKAQRPGVKVALLTGSAEITHFEGADAVLIKPVTPPKLVEQIRKLLASSTVN